jgi:hypothetical protein
VVPAAETCGLRREDMHLLADSRELGCRVGGVESRRSSWPNWTGQPALAARCSETVGLRLPADPPWPRGRGSTRPCRRSGAVVGKPAPARPDRDADFTRLGATDITAFCNRMAFLQAGGHVTARRRLSTCRMVKTVLDGFRILGLTRPGQCLAGLPDDFALPVHRDPATSTRPAPAPAHGLPAALAALGPASSSSAMVSSTTDHDDRADPSRYAATMAEDRELQLKRYEVYRFGGADLADDHAAQHLLSTFFDRLASRYGS